MFVIFMSVVYPEYIIDESVYNVLWNMPFESSVYFRNPAKLSKETIDDISYYWSDDVDYFKIVIDEYTDNIFNGYEGVFNKNDYDTNLLKSSLYNLTIQEKTHDHVILNYKNKISFTLSKVNFNYISNISENTKKLNDLIKKNYLDGIHYRISTID